MAISKLKTHCKKGSLCNVVVETPRLSRIKYKYDERSKLFKVSKVLPEGSLFPYDFGFLPGTRGDDGDPLDVLLFMDAPAFPGTLVEARVVGVLKAEQSEDGTTIENDRLVAICDDSIQYRNVQSISDFDKELIHQVEEFFVQYNRVSGKRFMPLGVSGKEEADELIEKGAKRFRKKSG
jgi:inorganic pyrophosphatase